MSSFWIRQGLTDEGECDMFLLLPFDLGLIITEANTLNDSFANLSDSFNGGIGQCPESILKSETPRKIQRKMLTFKSVEAIGPQQFRETQH